MSIRKVRLFAFLLFSASICALVFYAPQPLSVRAQQPTGSIPTVTGTPVGVIVALYLDRAQENVYAGPSSYLYPPVGLLIAGQEVPAYGISDDGNWIQIYYPGVPDSVAWVYAPFVKIVKNGSLPLVKAPPVPTPTALSLDPTLAAAFIAPSTPTRLPTFTAPAPLVVATFVDEVANTNQIPMGLLIFGLGFVGGLGVVISFLGRR